MKNTLFNFITSLLFITPLHATTPPTCTGSDAFLSILDRPSIGFSACTVPDKGLSFESGFAYQKTSPEGYAHNAPQSELRIGLANNTELDFFPPNYNQTSNPYQSGFSATSVGMRRVLFFDNNQIATLQGYITPPSGSLAFGTTKLSYLINGLYTYTFDSQLSFTANIGLMSISSPPDEPNKNYYSFNPIVSVGWALTDKISPYIEFYSQSKTALDRGWGVSMDGGLLILIAHNVSVDISAGQRISGVINDLDHYFGAGISFALGI